MGFLSQFFSVIIQILTSGIPDEILKFRVLQSAITRGGLSECHLHALMCSVTVVFIHTMEDDQRLNTLVHEGDTLYFRFIIAKRQQLSFSLNFH